MPKNKLSFSFIDEIRKRNSGVNPETIATEVKREIKKYRKNKFRKIHRSVVV